MIQAYEPQPIFYTNTELSATDINTLRNNALLLEGLSKRGKPILPIHYEIDDFPRSDQLAGSLLFTGGFRYLTGLTHARISIRSAGVTANAKYKVLFNTVQVATGTMPNGSSVGLDIAVTGRGYTDGQIIYVEVIFFSDPPDYLNKRPTYAYVFEAYVYPVSSITSIPAWPGLPSITADTNISAADLNQIVSAQDWLIQRLALVPYTPFISQFYQNGTHKAEQLALLYTHMMVVNSNSVLKGLIYFVSRNQSTYLRITIGNPATFVEYGPYSYNQEVKINVNINLSSYGVIANTETPVSFYERCVTGNPAKTPILDSRITVRDFVLSGASLVPSTTVPSISSARESLTFSNLKTRLQQIVDITQTARTNITTYTQIFDRQEMARSQLLLLYDHREKVGTYDLLTFRRLGDLLWVRGNGVKIGWGGINTKRPQDSEKWEYEFENSADLIPVGTNDTKIIYLNQFDSLFPGNMYYVFTQGGELNYCAEYLG